LANNTETNESAAVWNPGSIWKKLQVITVIYKGDVKEEEEEALVRTCMAQERLDRIIERERQS